MRRTIRWSWQTLVPFYLFVTCILAKGCSCDSPGKARHPITSPCVSQHESWALAESLVVKTIVPGSNQASFSVAESGNTTISLPLATVPGLETSLQLSYDDSRGDSGLGVGFAISGTDAITRCNKTLALDGENRNVYYDNDDALCAFGKRLVVIADLGDTIHYATWPDTQIKVIGHRKADNDSFFEALLPSGKKIRFGTSAATRPRGPGGIPRAWLAAEVLDARANVETSYGYCFANENDVTVEVALDEIRSAHGSPENTRAITLVYGQRDADATRIEITHGIPLKHSLALHEVQVFAPGKTLARRYAFTQETSAVTGRSRLTSVQECGADGACTPPLRFQYGKGETGFEDVTTNIEAPLSNKASFLFADFTGDGLSDYLVPDTIPESTATHPMTQWRLARNTGNSFAVPKVAFLQEWSFVQDPEGPSDPSLLQPELATALPFRSDGRMSLFLHDIYGNRHNHVMLLPMVDGTFEEFDTGIERPFPLGPSPKQLRNAGGSVHLAAVTPDGVPSLIQCDDHGSGSLSTWTMHTWRPSGFDSIGETIDALEGYPCDARVETVDVDKNGTVELVLPGMIKQGGVPLERAPTYYAFSRHSDGTWETFDTQLRIPTHAGLILFGDFNGDGLPDALSSDGAGRLVTSINIGKGFAAPVNSLDWDGIVVQDKYFHLAATADFDSDHRGDILLPMVDTVSPDVPHWVILRASNANGAFTFQRIESGIPFEAQLADAITLADPRGPRIGDFDGNGAPDVAIFLGNKLHIFKNRTVDPDVLVGYSDGLNEHDPEDAGFIPNVSITYGHLIDDSKTTGQIAKDADFYISQSDPNNACDYPRHCAVGSRRVVRAYTVNDGQGGVRRFGLRYRDGRYDRLGHGFLGFGKRFLTDLDTGATTLDIFDNVTQVKIGERDVYPFVGQMVQQWHWAPGLPTQPNPNQVEMSFAERLMDVVPTNDGASFFTLPTFLHTRRMQGTFASGALAQWVADVAKNENATMLRDSTVNVLDYDEYRNVLEVNVATVGVDATMHLERTVKNDVTRWNLGLPDTQTECSTAAGKTLCRTIKRTTNEFGEVETETTSSNDGLDDTKLTVVYDQRDKFGNVTHLFADDAFGNHREATTVYDPDGVFPVKHIDALGHETKTEYDKVLGVLKTITDANGRVTAFEHDGFARLKLEKYPDGSQTTITRTREKVGDVWQTKQRATTTGGADDETIFDSLGRPVRSFSFGPQPNGQKPARIMQVVQYDRLSGNVARKSVPTAEGTPDSEWLFDVYTYDALEREIRHTTPWNATTTTKYEGFLIDTADPLLMHNITKIDTLGRPVTILDAAKGITSYTYGPFNMLATVTDPGNAVTRWTRDAFGRPTKIEEPNRGTTTLTHNAFGDLVSSTDALGRVATFGMDALGRTTTRMDKVGAQVLTTTWTWDTAPNGIGKLHTLTSPDAVKTYSYTSKVQAEGMTLQIGNESFVARQFYDELGRVKRTQYPQPLGVDAFEVSRDFDAHGYVVGVRNAATNEAFWELKDIDQTGRYAEETFGNGTKTVRGYDNAKQSLKTLTTTLGGSTIQQLSYDWTEQLNLRSRSDVLQTVNKTERFRYDELDRLTCAYFGAVENANAACATSYSYMADGNLWSKSDVGTYSYADAKHPHAVTNVPGETFGYDAVGNQIARPGGVGITYTPFDLPKTITKGGQTTTFGYDGDDQRIRKTTPTSETIYVGDIFEQVTSGAVKEFRYSVHSPERVIAIVTRGGNEPGTKYVHADHLGSTETVTDESGAVIEKRSYDASGKRRNAKWGEPLGVFSSKTTKGFTGHEEDEEWGLVNAKGRLYDPRIARFTTTDPVIADIWDGQSFNAYTYVWNNPLAFTDPTGFSAEDLLWRTAIIEDASGAPLGLKGWYEEAPEPEVDPFVIPDHAAKIGAYVAPVDVGTTGPGAAPVSSEGFGSFFEGMLLGSFADNDSWSATAGSIIGGLIPGVGLAADIRDFGAAISHVADGKDGAWFELGASIVGFVPGGDIAKGIAKGVTKGTAKATAKIGQELVQEVAKVAKASTAKVVDDVAALQQGAAKARKGTPRGPPTRVEISRTKSPDALKHLEETGQTGRPLTVDRPGADARRRGNMEGVERKPGMDRDESPPAVFAESGGASVRRIPSSDNRSAGGQLRHQLKGVPNGATVVIVPKE